MEKTDLLFQMLEQPDRYSDQEWEEILADEECRELYTLMAQVKGAVMSEELSNSTRPEPVPIRRTVILPFRKIAALFLGIVMLSGFAYAAVRTSFFTEPWSEDKAQMAEVKTADADPTEHTAYAPEIKMVGDSVILFKDFRLDSIMMQIDKYYQVESQFADAESRSMRLLFKWNRQHSLEEVLERMNGFERLKVRREEDKLIVEQNAAME